MSSLELLGMKKNWTYEVVLTSFSVDIPHAAPFGVKTNDFEHVTLEMYKGSQSLENVLTTREFVLNIGLGPETFYDALYDKKNLSFDAAKIIRAPVLKSSPAKIEARVVHIDDRAQPMVVTAQVVHIDIDEDKPCELINRAKSLLLESLILSTRLPYLPSEKTENTLKENKRVITKVAPGSKYELVMKELVKKCGIEGE